MNDTLVDGTSASADPEIISTETEIIAYPNHTAKLSCVVQHKTRHHVSHEQQNAHSLPWPTRVLFR